MGTYCTIEKHIVKKLTIGFCEGLEVMAGRLNLPELVYALQL